MDSILNYFELNRSLYSKRLPKWANIMQSLIYFDMKYAEHSYDILILKNIVETPNSKYQNCVIL